MPLDTRQPGCLPPGVSTRAFNDNIAAPGSTNPGIPVTELKGAYGAEHHASCLHPSFQALLPSHDQRLPEQRFSCFDRLWGFGAAPHAAVKSSEKRFLIFDQSGNQTRLLRCAFPLQYPSAMAAEPTKLPDLHDLEKGIGKEHFVPEKFCLHEEFDENHLSGEESEMHEDTEEINALLYSDDDDDNGDDGGDDCNSDDEVMSTGHSPFPLKEMCNKTELEEIDGSGGPHKRQKLMDGGYKSSFLDSESSIKLQGLHKGEKPPESNNSSKQEMGSGLSDEQSRKDKIRTALKILENIVPGAKGKEALLLLDEAIDYLKLLKQNAKSFGLSYC